MANSKNEPKSPNTKAIIGVSILITLILQILHIPAGIIFYIGFLLASFIVTPPLISDKKGVPRTDREEKDLATYRYWQFYKSALFTGDTLQVFKKLALIPFFFLLICALTYWLPCAAFVALWFKILSCVFYFIGLFSCYLAVRSVSFSPRKPPVISIPDIIKSLKDSKSKIIVFALGAFMIIYSMTILDEALAEYQIDTQLTLAFVLLALSLVLLYAYLLTKRSLMAHFRELLSLSKEWEEKLKTLKMDPTPFLNDFTDYKNSVSLEFSISDGSSSDNLVSKVGRAKFRTIFPTDGVYVVTYTLDRNQNGEPIDTQASATKFRILFLKTSTYPDITAPDMDKNEIGTILDIAISRAVGDDALTASLSKKVTKITKDDTKAVYCFEFTESPTSADVGIFSLDYLYAFEGQLGCNAIADMTKGIVYVGDFETDGFDDELASTFWAEDPEANTAKEYISALIEIRDFREIFMKIIDKNMNPPTPFLGSKQYVELLSDKHITQMVFGVHPGETPSQFYSLDDKFASALDGAQLSLFSPYYDGENRVVSSTYFTATWSSDELPTKISDIVMPSGSSGQGERALVASRFMQGVKKMKGDVRPAIMLVTCLTTPVSKAIWHITCTIQEATLADLRKKQEALRALLQVPYLRIDWTQAGVFEFYVGETPDRATFKDEKQANMLFASLDWQKAFETSGIVGYNGALPRLTGYTKLESNKNILQLDFTLPHGISKDMITKGKDALQKATNNVFLQEVRDVEQRADVIRFLSSKTDPLPEMVDYDYTAYEAYYKKGQIPLGITELGDTATFDPKRMPHLLVTGSTGSGKSVLAQSIVYASITSGWDTFIVDPEKGAADFKFAEPYVRALGADLKSAIAVCRYVKNEVHRRRDLNKAAGLEHIDKLPDGQKLPHMLLFIDEFNTLIQAGKVRKSNGSTKDNARYAKDIQDVDIRTEIASIVGELSAVARSAGCSVILGAQNLKADDLKNIPNSGSLKMNMGRVLLGRADWGTKASALRDAAKAPVIDGNVPKGRGIFEPSDGPANIIQSFWTGGSDKLTAEINSHMPNSAEKISLEAFETADLSEETVKEFKPTEETQNVVLEKLDFSNMGD
jgi:hypothetical protein